jgi:hypothetical protein
MNDTMGDSSVSGVGSMTSFQSEIYHLKMLATEQCAKMECCILLLKSLSQTLRMLQEMYG